MVAPCNTPEEIIAFCHLLTDFVDIPTGSPGRLILDDDGITTVPLFIQMSDQYFMDVQQDVVVKDDASTETTCNQLLQIVKCVPDLVEVLPYLCGK